MKHDSRLKQWIASLSKNRVVLVLLALVVFGLLWQFAHRTGSQLDGYFISRSTEGMLTGRMPNPADPTIRSVLEDKLNTDPEHKLMVIKHIPTIKKGAQMPHPFVGDCMNCHLFEGGAQAGSQYKTPAGALLEEMSRVHKMGPPLRANSQRPHPPAGRCIKCHDIVVRVPVERMGAGFVM